MEWQEARLNLAWLWYYLFYPPLCACKFSAQQRQPHFFLGGAAASASAGPGAGAGRKLSDVVWSELSHARLHTTAHAGGIKVGAGRMVVGPGHRLDVSLCM